MMTMSQAAARQVEWKQRAYRAPCGHLVLELERNEQGYLTDNYVCNLCGKSFGPTAPSPVASRPVPAPSTAHSPQPGCWPAHRRGRPSLTACRTTCIVSRRMWRLEKL